MGQTMAKFRVTITRTLVTEVFVEADSKAAARRQIEDYGIIEAAVDMASEEAGVSAKIASVEAA